MGRSRSRSWGDNGCGMRGEWNSRAVGSNTTRLSGGSGLEQGCGGDGFRLLTSHGMPVEAAWKLCCLMQMTWRGPPDMLSVSRLPGVSVQGGPGLGVWRVGLANVAPAAPPPSGLKHDEIHSAKFHHGTKCQGSPWHLAGWQAESLPCGSRGTWSLRQGLPLMARHSRRRGQDQMCADGPGWQQMLVWCHV